MERKVTLQAEHIAGTVNTQMDKESRVMIDRWDWKLHPQIFSRLNRQFGPFQIDLFASRVSTQLRRFYNWRPDPLAEGTDAFLQMWPEPVFANPPWALISRVLREVLTQRATITLIAPVWKTQVWYPTLLNFLVDYPVTLPAEEETITQVNLLPLPIQGQEVQLAAWPISGDPAKQEAFQRELQSSSCAHGERSPSPPTTHSFTSGSAGALNGIEIPFMDL